MYDNYPPGVTGNEYQIAGADREHEAERECRECGLVQLALIEEFQSSAWWFCENSECGAENDEPVADDEPEEPDLEPDWLP